MENGRFVTYTDKDRDIVRKGICEIAKVLLGDDTQRKLSMLFCLDWFMDPYYQQDTEPNEDDVIEDAIELLMSYELPPFPLIEEKRNRIPLKFQDDIAYLLDPKSFEE